jgi:hypothetical protein
VREKWEKRKWEGKNLTKKESVGGEGEREREGKSFFLFSFFFTHFQLR